MDPNQPLREGVKKLSIQHKKNAIYIYIYKYCNTSGPLTSISLKKHKKMYSDLKKKINSKRFFFIKVVDNAIKKNMTLFIFDF